MLEIVLIFAAAVERWDRTAREANRLQEAGQFLDAEGLYRDALAQAVAIHPRCHATATSRNNLAVVCYRLGRYDGASESYRAAIRIWRELGRLTDLTASQANLAELVHAQGRDEAALAESASALAERERSGIASSQPLLVHGNILRSLARHAEARRYLKEAAALARRETPDREGFALSSIANLELAAGNFPEAREAARKAIRIWGQAAGARSLHTANARILLARALRAEDDLGAAERELRETLEILSALLGRTNPRVIPPLADLAGLLERRGRSAAALELLKEAERASATRGRGNPALAPYLNNLATVRYKLGERPGAEALFRQSLALREASLGPIHVDLTETRLNLAIVCLASGRAAEARPLAERTLAIRQHALGASHPSMSQPLFLYSKVLTALGETKQAKRIEAAARAVLDTVPGSRHSLDWRQLKTGLR